MHLEEAIGPILTVLFLLGMALEVGIGRDRFPVVRGWRLMGVGFFIANALVNVVLPLAIPVAWLAEHSLLPGTHLGVAGGFALGFVVFTFVYYWYHRLEHRFDLLWRFLHQLHHSARRVDMAGFPFAHPLDVAGQTVLALVLNVFVLGLDPVATALVGLYPGIAALVQHVNVRTPQALEWILQRPEAHVRHHEFGVHAFNYADWPVWDKLFGTYRAPASETPRVGFDEAASVRIGAMLLGVDVNRKEPARLRQ